MFKNSPFVWDQQTKYVTSQTVGVNIKDNTGTEEKAPLKLSFPNTNTAERQPVYLSIPRDSSESSRQTFYYKLYWQQPTEDLMFTGEGPTSGMTFTVYVRGGSGPTSIDYDWSSAIPASLITVDTYKIVIPGGLFSVPTTTYIAVNIQTRKFVVTI